MRAADPDRQQESVVGKVSTRHSSSDVESSGGAGPLSGRNFSRGGSASGLLFSSVPFLFLGRIETQRGKEEDDMEERRKQRRRRIDQIILIRKGKKKTGTTERGEGASIFKIKGGQYLMTKDNR